MPCGAQIRGDQMYCFPCRLQWDLSDPNPPACQRNGEGKDPQLKPQERNALKACAETWFNRRGGKYRARGSRKAISIFDAATLVALKLAFFSNTGGLRATTYGEQWLKRHTRQQAKS